MNDIRKLFLSKSILRSVAIIISILFYLISPKLSYSVNEKIFNIYNRIPPKKAIDTNIVLLTIDKSEIQKHGWPLKRKHYAELIDKLTEISVKKIGIEIVLSNNGAADSSENQFLKNSIVKSGKVVLASIITDKNKYGEKFGSDSLIYSAPKVEGDKINSGHLNYFLKNGIFIPSFIELNGKKENSFASELINDYENSQNDLYKINFYASWKQINKISISELLGVELTELDAPNKLKNKIVVIGSLLNTTAISTPFDENLPGVGFQALVVDNILTGRIINQHAYAFSSVMLVIIVIIIANVKIRSSNNLLLLVFTLSLFSFVLFKYFCVETPILMIFSIIILFSIIEIYFVLMKNKKEHLNLKL